MHRLELEKLKSSIVAMGQMCEYNAMTAMTALIDNDLEVAEQVSIYDNEIDEMELLIDRQCRHLLASAAGKLEKNEVNFILSAHRTNNDMERIGDQAVQIANHARFLLTQQSILSSVVDFLPMFEQVGEMIRESVVALLENDPDLAWKIVDEQLIVNDSFRLIFREVVDIMKHGAAMIERAAHLLFIAQALQRMADLTVNIAEEIIFVAQGKTIRHHLREYRPLHSGAHSPEEVSAMEISVAENRRKPARQAHRQTRDERWRLIKEQAEKLAAAKKAK